MKPELSQTPYLIRAFWEWCGDAGLSPQILVRVDEHTQVPMGFAVNGQIIFDIGAEATNQLELGNEWISFQARFGVKVENIMVPITHVVAIFAEETGQMMAFEPISEMDVLDDEDLAAFMQNDEPLATNGKHTEVNVDSAVKEPPSKPKKPSKLKLLE